MKIKNKIIPFLSILLFLVAWTIIISFTSPEEIINSLGVTNSYLIVFIICLLGGISILFPIPYYLAVFTFGAGGSNPFLIGLVAGLGLAIGDTTSYIFGYTGRKVLSVKEQKLSDKIYKKLNSYPEWTRALMFFIWGAVIPLPNDLLLVPMGAIKYPYKKVVVPLVLGSIVLNTLIALAGFYGINIIISLIQNLF